jgi:subtilisin family serine protease
MVNFVDGGEHTFTQDHHGTAVAGIIAASADNAIGIFGIAPDADLVAVKACWHPTAGAPEALCSSWTLAKAIDFVIHAEARVMNLSLTGPHDPLLARLIKTALERHITVVTAVLEDSAQGPGFPASLDTVIAIHASDPHGQVRNLVKRLPTPGLAAPGVEILSTAPSHTYAFLSGSSLAAAHVTGMVALLLEHAAHLSPAHVHALLRATARPVSSAGPAGHSVLGVVDACAALEKLLQRPGCV